MVRQRVEPPAILAPPVLVELRRGPVVEARHRGHVVQVAIDGSVERAVGNPDEVRTIRSGVKPFTLVALIESGAADAFTLSDKELALLASSHAGNDDQVETLRGVLARAGVDEQLLACGTEGAPDDPETRERLIREGTTAKPVHHMCSGFHAASLLLSQHAGWSPEGYDRPDHPSQRAIQQVLDALLGRSHDALGTALDDCAMPTYAMRMREMAHLFALLADPHEASDERVRRLAPSLQRVRDGMMAAPEMVNGAPGGVDTLLMQAGRGALVCKEGAEGLEGVGVLRGARAGSGAAGLIVSVEDGDKSRRSSPAVTVEALRQLGALDGGALEKLRDLHEVRLRDSQGRLAAELVPVFQLPR